MKAPSIRIASYNLQKCVGLDLRRRPDRSLTVINALKADLVVLQEADKRRAPRHAALPHGMAEAEGWQILPFGAEGVSLGWHGNAMLARPRITLADTGHLDLPGLEPRGAVRADLLTPIGPLRVVGVHLGLMRRHRHLQISSILRSLDRLEPMPTLLTGDFNEWGDIKGLDATARHLNFVVSPPSYPAPRPVARLDRFALGPDLRALRTGIYQSAPARVASDHLPVWADIAPSESA